MKDTLGDRIKGYESIYEHYFLPKIPIIVRIDGKAFHTQVKKWNCEKPFDQTLINCMFATAKDVAANIQGCKALYTQSDEVTFVLTDDDNIETQQWFGGRQNKIESVTASMMTAVFNSRWINAKRIAGEVIDINILGIPAVFDARAFQCPKDDVANVFLWRVKDWERNSLNMYCEQFFSHKELDGQGRADRHEMLHKIGHNWATECTDQQKNGSWWSCDKVDNFNLTNYQEIDDYIFRDGIAYVISKRMERDNSLGKFIDKRFGEIWKEKGID